jgi:hypothetical protein
MTDLRAAIGGEENQITGLQAFFADIRCLHDDQLARGARQVDAGGITINKSDQTTAIETRIRRVATPAIRRAHQTKGAEQHIFRSGRKRLGRAEHNRRTNYRRRRRCTTGAGAEQRCEEHQCEAGRHRHKQNILIWLRLFLPEGQKTKPPAWGRRRFAIKLDSDSSGYAANFK